MSTLTISIIQSDLHWQDKAANLSLFEKKITSIQEKTEIIVLPEMFSTGFSMEPEKLAEDMNGTTIKWMKRIAAERRAIITGSIIIKENTPHPNNSPTQTNYYNRLIWMLPNGQYGYYDKRHLFGFAQEDLHYTPGNKRLIASVKGWKINLLICYDLRFPVWSRQAHLFDEEKNSFIPEYDLVIYVANWPERRSTAWKALLQARAIENQCYVVGCNRVGNDGHAIYHSGDSMIIDPLGEILYHKKNSEDIFTITLKKDHLLQVREKFPFWEDGDTFIIEK